MEYMLTLAAGQPPQCMQKYPVPRSVLGYITTSAPTESYRLLLSSMI